MKKVPSNLVALTLGLLLAAALAEGALRVYQRAVHGTPLFSLLPGYRPATRFGLSPFLSFGPPLNRQFAEPRDPKTSYFNHQGFRTRDTLGLKPAGQFRVFALGGSTTVDSENEEGIHWPLVAERTLHAQGRTDVRVYNGGMHGYSTAQSLVRFEFDILEYAPDAIIVMHNVNDLLVNYYAWHRGRTVDANYLVKYGEKAWTGVVSHDDAALFRLWHSVRRRYSAWRSERPAPVRESDIALEPGRSYFKRNLRNLVILARGNNVATILATMPMCDDPGLFRSTVDEGGEPAFFPGFERFRADFESYNDAIREVASELNVPLIDLHRAVPGEPALFVDVVHHSAAGVRAIGAAAAEVLLALLPPASAAGTSTPAQPGR